MTYKFSLNLHPTQLQVYNDPHIRKVICAGKGWGKTKFVTRCSAAIALTHEGSEGAVIAPYGKQANYDFQEIKRLIPKDRVEKTSERWMSMTLKNGSEIMMGSADNVDGLRGFAWDSAIVDEAAFCDPEVFSIVDSQVGKKRGFAWYVSTPNGKGPFYEVYSREQNDPKRYKSFHFTTYDNPYYPIEELESMKINLPELVFRQEIMAEFLEGGIVFPHLSEIMTSTPRSPVQGHNYVTGADLASVNDFTVIKVFDTADNYEVYTERFTSRDWSYIRQSIYSICKQYNNSTLIIDKTGVGAPVVEDLEKMDAAYQGAKKEGYLAVVAFPFSSKSKPELFKNYIMAQENRTIHLIDDPVTKREHEDFMAVLSQNSQGYVKYGAPKGRHDDTVCAAALAAWGLEKIMLGNVMGTQEVMGKSDVPDDTSPYNQEQVTEWEEDPDAHVGFASHMNKKAIRELYKEG